MRSAPLAILLLLPVVAFLFNEANRVTPNSASAAPSQAASTDDAPPVDDAELLAAIRAARDTDAARSDEVRRLLAELSGGQPLPAGATLEVDSLRDLGGRYVYDVLDIFLVIPLDTGKELRIPVRRRFVRSRTIVEEVARLKDVLADAPARPGRYRLEDRVKELEARAKKIEQQ